MRRQEKACVLCNFPHSITPDSYLDSKSRAPGLIDLRLNNFLTDHISISTFGMPPKEAGFPEFRLNDR